jgi:hypothetical protein
MNPPKREEIMDAVRQVGDFLQPYLKQMLDAVDHDPSLIGLYCPLGYTKCGKLDEILKEYSDTNVFVGIPYSNYPYEESIKEVIDKAGLSPKLAKDKIKTQTLLCKVCKTIRVCPYATIDYGDANLNVVYELGLLHSLGKVVAILKPTTIPSDLQGLEYLDHNGSTESLKLELGKWLRDNVSSVNGEQLEEYLKELTIQKHGLQ